jgi:ATP-dependent Clp protease protease subunit
MRGNHMLSVTNNKKSLFFEAGEPKIVNFAEAAIEPEDDKVFWKLIKAENSDPEILFYGSIASSAGWFSDEITPKRFAKDIADLGNVERIKVRINSPGGDLIAANAIYNILKNHSAKITSYIDGLAASAASIVLMAGDEIVIPLNALIMIHNPATKVFGDARAMRKTAETLDTARESMLAIYESRTGIARAKLISMLNAETWMDSKTAIALGFADSIDDKTKIAASLSDSEDELIVNGIAFDAHSFTNIPKDFISGKESTVKNSAEIEDDMPTLFINKTDDGIKCNLWCPFVNGGIKEDERMVYGYATLFGVVDKQNQRMTKQAVENALPDYEKKRIVMDKHNKVVGSAPALQIDDTGLFIGAKIADDCTDVWNKIKNKVYKGFSVGGWVKGKKNCVEDGRLVTDITSIILDEVSVADKPICPGTVYQFISDDMKIIINEEGGEIMSKGEDDNKSIVESFVSWLKGEGKDDIANLIQVDLSSYATKDDIKAVTSAVEGLQAKIETFVASASVAAAPATEAPEAPEAPAIDPQADATAKAIGAMSSNVEKLATAVSSVMDRVTSLEDSKGARKSSEVIGNSSSSDDIWKGAVPEIK